MGRASATLSARLRQLRLHACLSQEELAAKAGLSVRTVSDLERGVHVSARPHTIAALADALMLDTATREAFVRLATPEARRGPARPPVAAPLARLASTSVLRGRDAELAALDAAVARAAAGEAQLVVVTGGAGIGKTRLLAELAVRADRLGAAAFFARADEAIGDPYHGFVQILRQYLAVVTPETFVTESPHDAAALAALLPELELPPPAHPTRAALFDAVANVVGNCSGNMPCVLLFDDAHHVDLPDLYVLRHLLRTNAERRVLVVVAYRTDGMRTPSPIEQVAAELARDVNVERMTLDGLDPLDVERVVADRLGQPFPALARVLQRETNGNPLFVRELVAHFSAGGHLDGHTWRTGITLAEQIGVPAGVRDLLSARLAQLSEATREGLTVCAVMGAVFDVHLVSALMQEPEDAVFSFVDEAVRAGVVVEDELYGRWHFAHPLYRAVLTEALSHTARSRWHARIVDTLEACGDDSPDVIDMLAYHSASASNLPGMAPRAIAHARRAAIDAARVFAWERAAAHYERAVTVMEAQPDHDPIELCDLVLALADARVRSLERQHALPLFLRAAELATELGSLERVVRAAVGYGYMAKAAVADDRALECWEKALVGTDDPAMRATLLAARATHMWLRGNDRQARDESEHALELARSTDDDRALAVALAARSIALWGTPDVETRFLVSRELAAHGGHCHDDEWMLDGIELVAVPLLQSGRVDAFDAVAGELAVAGRKAGHATSVAQATQWFAMRALMQGRLADARRLAHDVIEIAPNAPNFALGFAAQHVMIERASGRAAELVPFVASAVERNPDLLAWRSVYALLLAEHSDDGAHQALDAVVEMLARAPRDWTWVASAIGAATAAVALRRADAAAAVEPLLEPYSGQLVVIASGTSCEGPVDLYLALLAATLGRPRIARERFEAALALHRRVDGDALLVRTRREYAQFLRTVGTRDAIAQARRLDAAAASVADALGIVHRPALRALRRAQGAAHPRR